MTAPHDKIVDWQSLLEYRALAASRGQRFVLTNGVFDVLHRGHLEYLWSSSRLGDVLAVLVTSDASVRLLKGAGRPLVNEADRAFALASLGCVGVVNVFPGPNLASEILALKPDLYTKAADYSLDTLDAAEREALDRLQIEIRLIPLTSGYSTTSLLDRLRLSHARVA